MSVRYRVRIDGQPGSGVPMSTAGAWLVTEQRTYQLIRQPRPIEDRQFETSSSMRASKRRVHFG